MASLVSWSAGLFLAGGAVWLLIGALTPYGMNTAAGRSSMVFSANNENASTDPSKDLATLRRVLFFVVAGLLVVAGLAVMALAYFAWREGHPWAFATLTAIAVAAAAFWLLSARAFLASGRSISFVDLPPFMWVTTVLWLPAIVLGAISLRTRAAAP